MKPLILSTSDIGGGAARAAYRLHRALQSIGVDSAMEVQSKLTDDSTVVGPRARTERVFLKAKQMLGRKLSALQITDNPNLHSIALFPSMKLERYNKAPHDVVNLHWINGEFLSVAEIGQISKPIVWTLHDMWAFTGTEHYCDDGPEARWRQGYGRSNALPTTKGPDLAQWTWRRKKTHWLCPIRIVTPSKWLASCVAESSLMKGWPVSVIPNPINTEIFKPWPKQLAREILQLPKTDKIILFGALGGTRDLRKGWRELVSALHFLKSAHPTTCVIFGQSAPEGGISLPFRTIWAGHLHDDYSLALLYSAADVMIVPSLQENLPQSGTEAQSCGCPVVAFNVCGLPDVVVHKHTGYLAQPYDCEDLARGISWVLSGSQSHEEISANARTRSLAQWSPEVVVKQYVKVYENAIALSREQNLM